MLFVRQKIVVSALHAKAIAEWVGQSQGVKFVCVRWALDEERTPFEAPRTNNLDVLYNNASPFFIFDSDLRCAAKYQLKGRNNRLLDLSMDGPLRLNRQTIHRPAQAVTAFLSSSVLQEGDSRRLSMRSACSQKDTIRCRIMHRFSNLLVKQASLRDQWRSVYVWPLLIFFCRCCAF